MFKLNNNDDLVANDVFLNSDYVSHLVLVFLSLTLGMYLFAEINEYKTA